MPCNENWVVTREDVVPLLERFQDAFDGQMALDVVLLSAVIAGNMIADAASTNNKTKRAWMNEAALFHTELTDFVAEVVQARAETKFPSTEWTEH